MELGGAPTLGASIPLLGFRLAGRLFGIARIDDKREHQNHSTFSHLLYKKYQHYLELKNETCLINFMWTPMYRIEGN